jgi:hypothetical protein
VNGDEMISLRVLPASDPYYCKFRGHCSRNIGANDPETALAKVFTLNYHSRNDPKFYYLIPEPLLQWSVDN